MTDSNLSDHVQEPRTLTEAEYLAELDALDRERERRAEWWD